MLLSHLVRIVVIRRNLSRFRFINKRWASSPFFTRMTISAQDISDVLADQWYCNYKREEKNYERRDIIVAKSIKRKKQIHYSTEKVALLEFETRWGSKMIVYLFNMIFYFHEYNIIRNHIQLQFDQNRSVYLQRIKILSTSSFSD